MLHVVKKQNPNLCHACFFAHNIRKVVTFGSQRKISFRSNLIFRNHQRIGVFFMISAFNSQEIKRSQMQKAIHKVILGGRNGI